jgi:hypothetical protein
MSTTSIVGGATHAIPSYTQRFTRLDAAEGPSTRVLTEELAEVCHALDGFVARARTLCEASA